MDEDFFYDVVPVSSGSLSLRLQPEKRERVRVVATKESRETKGACVRILREEKEGQGQREVLPPLHSP